MICISIFGIWSDLGKYEFSILNLLFLIAISFLGTIFYWFVYARKASTLGKACLPFAFINLGINYMLSFFFCEKVIADLVLFVGVVLFSLLMGFYLFKYGKEQNQTELSTK